MLERMKAKVEEEEALAEAYSDMAGATTSVDDEIDKAIGSGSTQGDDSLARLKAKMGLPAEGA
jgi:phage shock protein A